MKLILRDFIPPIIWRNLSKTRNCQNKQHLGRKFAYGVEQPPEFYDQTYENKEHWKAHYTESHYYLLWTVIADRIRHTRAERILGIGCGPGQVASLMRDIGVNKYKGIDFSHRRIERARIVCPEYEFFAVDVFEEGFIESDHYDCVLVMEFLEHVEKDIDVIEKIQIGKTVIGTVPNFPSAGHVRHFNSVEEVEERYSGLFSQLEVTEILADKHGKTYYILQGTR